MSAAATICPYCRTPVLDDSEPGKIYCTGCGTPHHEDCYAENGGCTVFGCTCAPADEPKLSIGASEAHAAAPMPMAMPYPAPVFPTHIPLGPPPPPLPPLSPNEPPPPPLPLVQGPFMLPTAPAPYRGNGILGLGGGAVATSLGYSTMQPSYAMPVPEVKSRTSYILLGVLLGYFGIHSFYAGYSKRGVAQLLITVLTFGVAAFASWVWAIVDVCTISTDANGVAFRD